MDYIIYMDEVCQLYIGDAISSLNLLKSYEFDVELYNYYSLNKKIDWYEMNWLIQNGF